SDLVVVIGTEAADNFVVTAEGVQGAGLNVSFVGVERLEVDGLEGDDHFFILSTSPRLVTTIIGGEGNDTFDVGGDVTQEIVALEVEGKSGFINHSVASADPAYNGIFAEGIKLNLASANTGAFLVDDGDGVVLTEGQDGSYRLSVNVARPSDHTVAYVTVSAALASFKDARNGGRSVQVSLTGNNDDFHDALVVTF